MVKGRRFRVESSKYAGYCYGVERALKLAMAAAESSEGPIRTLGPIIHNPQVIDELVAKGINSVDDIDGVDYGVVIIRTHGVGPQVIEAARVKGLTIIDATCPFVSKAQRRADELVGEGYQVIIVGERDHPEVAGILAHAGGKALVVESADDLPEERLDRRIGVVVQTTQSPRLLNEVLAAVTVRCGELRVFNTICNATVQRQDAAAALAKRADVVVVVGGKNSANTSRLARICEEAGAATYHVETAAELQPHWFDTATLVGVTAGASTPERLINDVVSRLTAISEEP